MKNNKKILIEIGTEFLPSKELNIYLKILLTNFKKLLKKNLVKYIYIKSFITINRITFLFECKEIKYDIIKLILEELIYKTSFKKKMKWNNFNESFIRPIKWYVLMNNNEIIKHSIFNINSKNETYKSLFNKEKKIKINFSNYEKKINNAGIILNKKKRLTYTKNIILQSLKKNEKIIIKKIDFNNIINSFECPKIIPCKFKKKFLKLPEKLIIHVLNEKQCLPITKKNMLKNNFFVMIENYVIKKNKIKIGYQKSINIKLSEINYFYNIKDTTLKNTEKKKLNIKYITILKKLNIYNLTIVKFILKNKTDINNKLVIENNNLLNIKTAHKLKKNILIKHFLYDYNNILNNSIPKKKEIAIIVLIELIEKITHFYLLNNMPKNKKDPFNIRRDTLTLIKIIVKNKIKINIKPIISFFLKNNIKKNTEIINTYILNRLKNNINNKYLAYIKSNDIYTLTLISKSIDNIKKYNFKKDIHNIGKRINKIVIKNKIKTNYSIKKYIKKKNKIILIKKVFYLMTVLKKLKTKNLYFEYIKSTLKLKKTINNFFNKTLILSSDKIEKNINIKILKIIDKKINSLITLNEIEIK